VKPWEPEDIAREIIKGINKNKFAIAPGLEIKFLNTFHSLLFPLLNRYFDCLIEHIKS
jgi:3-dehydrosphinganine reductase